MSIPDILIKIKGFLHGQAGHDLMIVLVILGVSVSSFALGALSSQKDDSKVIIKTDPNLIITTPDDYSGNSANSIATRPDTDQNQITTNQSSGLPFVASKKGKKYYPVGCPASKSLSKTNLIYFKDEIEAEAKGYSLSTSCQ